MSDATLVATILAGETSEFARIVERYLPLVRGICASHDAPEPGALDLRLCYRTRPRGAEANAPADGDAPGGSAGGDRESWPPVPGARVTLKPLRPNGAVRELLFGQADVDPRWIALLEARAVDSAEEPWSESLAREGLSEPIVARETSRLERLRERFGETGLKSLLGQLVGPAPREEWIVGESRADGTVSFSALAAGACRVEVSLVPEDPTSSPIAEARARSAPGPREVGMAVVDRGRVATTLAVRIHPGEREQRTLRVDDTVSEIRGRIVDAETGDPVGPVALFASGEAFGDTRERVWVGSDGAFRVPGSSTGFGAFEIGVEPKGYVPAAVEGVRRPGEPIDVTIALSRRATISGLVREPDGSPVAGIVVMRRDVDGSGARSVATTDEERRSSTSAPTKARSPSASTPWRSGAETARSPGTCYAARETSTGSGISCRGATTSCSPSTATNPCRVSSRSGTTWPTPRSRSCSGGPRARSPCASSTPRVSRSPTPPST